LASGGAELVSCAILTPAEVIKQNAQMVDKNSMGGKTSPTMHVLKKFRKQPTQLWRGYSALAARNLPFTALQFPVFEKLKTYFMDRRKQSKGGEPVNGILERASITAVSASIAGSGSAWVTTPIDVVKTRIMLAAAEEGKQPKQEGPVPSWLQGAGGARKSGFEVAKEVLQREGMRGLFRGAALRAGWTAMGSGLYLGSYEGGRFYLEDSRKAKNEGDSVMEKERDYSKVKVGIGKSRSQGENVKKSAWQDD
jgi:solute carrier family 25 (mitochondrial S-adenosylmethionine transporter), member 26